MNAEKLESLVAEAVSSGDARGRASQPRSQNVLRRDERCLRTRARVTGLVLSGVLLAAGYIPLAHSAGEPVEGCEFLNGREDAAPAPESLPWTNATLDPNQRVELLFAQMTLAEKIDMATGEPCGLYGFFNAPIPRLKIPALPMADGPAGVRIANVAVNGGLSTAMPAPIALAATWDKALARTYGDLLGDEAFLTGHNVLLGPTVDIGRIARGGRGFETFGEDPLLVGEMAVPYIEGVQSHPVLADAKHYNLYNQETDRLNGLNVIADERAIREIYTPPFEAAIERANVATVMCSFNKVNGVFQCEDPTMLKGLLKDTLGFSGFVLSDFGATQSTVPSALAGLDQEMPGGTFYGQHLLDAVTDGSVPMDVLDDKVRRILRTMFEHKLFDQLVQIGTLPEAEHGAIARDIAAHSIVLLKNSNSLLPLAAGGLKSIAVIGADATNITAQGGGSAQVDATYAVSPLDGIKKKVGSGVTVSFSEGTDPVTAAHVLPGGEAAVPSSVLRPTNGTAGSRGLSANYWLTSDFSGTPAVTRIDRQVAVSMGFMNFGLTPSSVPDLSHPFQLPTDFSVANFSARWTGTLTPPASGEYTLTLTTRGRGALYLNGTAIINDTQSHSVAASSATVQLTAGTAYDIRVDYVADDKTIGGGGGTVGGEALLSWKMPEGAVPPDITAAAEAAKSADVAIVFARDFETESLDRATLSLPNAQDQLIAQVVAANPRTIVVLQSGMPVTMPWLESAPAVLEAWYGGQEQGNAIAAVLFGDVNPSGKLPVSFPKSETMALGNVPAQYPGVNLQVSYSESIYVGYRWFDHFKVDPLFPFGYGLSYTTFQYSGLTVDAGSADNGLQPPVNVSFTVTNSGSRAGAEVAQVYVGTLPGSVETPARQLAGFEKVDLAAGESKTVTVQVDPRSLSYWNTTTHAWVTPSGVVPIYVGSSSRDVLLTGSAQVGVKEQAEHERLRRGRMEP
jgi:beta-glucosidase